jgi:hypothetical protein
MLANVLLYLHSDPSPHVHAAELGAVLLLASIALIGARWMRRSGT